MLSLFKRKKKPEIKPDDFDAAIKDLEELLFRNLRKAENGEDVITYFHIIDKIKEYKETLDEDLRKEIIDDINHFKELEESLQQR